MMHVFVIQDSPDGLRTVGQALSSHRSVGGIEVEASNIIEVLNHFKRQILKNEKHYAGLPD